MRYEYQWIKNSASHITQKVLNEYGIAGWRVVYADWPEGAGMSVLLERVVGD